MSLVVDIKKRYPGFTLDIQLEAGEERVALLGASGCGKSCTLRCIAGVETPDEGRIVVNGVTFFDAAAGVNLTPQQRKCALLFQNYQLFPNMTAEQNVRAGMDDGSSERGHAVDFLRIFGMEAYASRYPAQLSGGQQQRVALARMLAARPGILMFDEPFSALDSYLKSALEQNLLDVFSVIDRTVLYVSHDIDEACRLCERICVLHNGRVEEQGTVDELMAAPRTLAGMRLTGCKNTSRARKVGEHEVEALDWGMTFDVGREVPDDVAYLGVRANYIHRDRDCAEGPYDRVLGENPSGREDADDFCDHGCTNGARVLERMDAALDRGGADSTRDQSRAIDASGRNSFDLRVARVSDARFERLVLLDPPRADAPSRLQWKVSKVNADPAMLPHEGETLCLIFDASRILLVSR